MRLVVISTLFLWPLSSWGLEYAAIKGGGEWRDSTGGVKGEFYSSISKNGFYTLNFDNGQKLSLDVLSFMENDGSYKIIIEEMVIASCSKQTGTVEFSTDNWGLELYIDMYCREFDNSTTGVKITINGIKTDKDGVKLLTWDDVLEHNYNSP